MDEIAQFQFQQLAGNSYICAGHMHAPTTPWTVDYMDKRKNLDISSFKVLNSGYQLDDNIHKLIDKFPTPEEFYYEDVSGIDSIIHYMVSIVSWRWFIWMDDCCCFC